MASCWDSERSTETVNDWLSHLKVSNDKRHYFKLSFSLRSDPDMWPDPTVRPTVWFRMFRRSCDIRLEVCSWHSSSSSDCSLIHCLEQLRTSGFFICPSEGAQGWRSDLGPSDLLTYSEAENQAEVPPHSLNVS